MVATAEACTSNPINWTRVVGMKRKQLHHKMMRKIDINWNRNVLGKLKLDALQSISIDGKISFISPKNVHVFVCSMRKTLIEMNNSLFCKSGKRKILIILSMNLSVFLSFIGKLVEIYRLQQRIEKKIRMNNSLGHLIGMFFAIIISVVVVAVHVGSSKNESFHSKLVMKLRKMLSWNEAIWSNVYIDKK